VKQYTLLDRAGNAFLSDVKGTLGGHKRQRLYGRLDCATALRYVAAGTYAKNRVFFADEATAIAAGYRPCARCMPQQFAQWRERQ